MDTNRHGNLDMLITMIAVPLVMNRAADARLVACVGASNTYGYGLAQRETECYPAELAHMLQAFDPTWEVHNFGVNGACVLQRGAFPYIRQSVFSQAQASNPDIVVIQLGGNDSTPANWVYRNDFLADFLVLIDAFAQLPSRPRIYVCSSPPFYSNPYGIDNSVVQSQIGPLMAQLATHRDVQMIDLHTPMKDSRDLFQSDGMHFTAEGARSVAEIVGAVILGMRGMPDFSRDGNVGIEDLVLLIEHWGQEEPSLDIAPPPFGDGIVDSNDLAAVMKYWGCQVKDPALVAHWRLDEVEGVIAADGSGANDGTLIGDAMWQPDGGRTGGALQFSAVGACISTSFVCSPSQGAFSAFAWVKGGAPGQVILSQMTGANWLMADTFDGLLTTEISSGWRLARPLKSAGVIADGMWHRVGFVWDGACRILYLDDVAVAQDLQPGLAASWGGLYIGAGSSLNESTFWSGLIDDVRIYDKAVRPVSE